MINKILTPKTPNIDSKGILSRKEIYPSQRILCFNIITESGKELNLCEKGNSQPLF